MTISGTLTTSISKPVEIQRTYQPPQTATAQPQKPVLTRRFDSVTISGETGRIFAQLAGDVRAAASSAGSASSLSALREEIQQGAYQPDSMEIARKMLLFGEGE